MEEAVSRQRTIFSFDSDLIKEHRLQALRNGNAEGESVLIQRLHSDWNNHILAFGENPLITWSFFDRISLSVYAIS